MLFLRKKASSIQKPNVIRLHCLHTSGCWGFWPAHLPHTPPRPSTRYLCWIRAGPLRIPDVSCHSSPGVEPRLVQFCIHPPHVSPRRCFPIHTPWLFTSVSTNLRGKVPWNSAHRAIDRPGRENNSQAFPPTLRFKSRCSLILLHVYLNSSPIQSSITSLVGSHRHRVVCPDRSECTCLQSPHISLFRLLLLRLWGSRALAPCWDSQDMLGNCSHFSVSDGVTSCCPRELMCLLKSFGYWVVFFSVTVSWKEF